MHPTTLVALRDELTKIAEETTSVGRLVNADVGKNQFPDTGDKKKQGIDILHITKKSPDPETHSPEAGEGNGGFTYD